MQQFHGCAADMAPAGDVNVSLLHSLALLLESVQLALQGSHTCDMDSWIRRSRR